MHEAEQYLRNPANPPHLEVIIDGKKRRLFINRTDNGGIIGIIALRKHKKGYVFSKWDTITKICYPKNEKENTPEDIQRKLVLKYQRLAAQATFTNPFLRKVAKAIPTKSLYENHITTGVRIDGEIITLEAIRKWSGEVIYREFKKALEERRAYRSGRFNFRGYDGSLWLEPYEDGNTYMKPGDINGGFSKEYRNCLNGYYYLLINDKNFIGYDID